MNDGVSFNSVNRMLRIVPVSSGYPGELTGYIYIYIYIYVYTYIYKIGREHV